MKADRNAARQAFSEDCQTAFIFMGELMPGGEQKSMAEGL